MKGVRSDDLESLSIKELIDKWNEIAAKKDKIVLVDMENYNENTSFKYDGVIYIIKKYVSDENRKLKDYIVRLIKKWGRENLKHGIFLYMSTRKAVSLDVSPPVRYMYYVLLEPGSNTGWQPWENLTDEEKETIIRLAKEVAKTGENPKLEQQAREIFSTVLKRTEGKKID